MTEPVHISVDIETTSTASNAKILTIGACTIAGTEYMDHFYVRIDHTWYPTNFATDAETMAWWEQQYKAAREEAFGGTRYPADALTEFADWVKQYRGSHLWCKGASFDFPVLKHAFRRYGIDMPWPYKAENDARTLYRLTGIKPVFDEGKVTHNALDDAVAQGDAIRRALTLLGAWERFNPEASK